MKKRLKYLWYRIRHRQSLVSWGYFQVELGDVLFYAGEDHLYVGNNKFLPLRKLNK